MKLEFTEQQVQLLWEIINRASIQGSAVEEIAGLKQVFVKIIEENKKVENKPSQPTDISK